MTYDSSPEMSFDEGSSAHSYEHFMPSFRVTSFDSPGSDLSTFNSLPQELFYTTVQVCKQPLSIRVYYINFHKRMYFPPTAYCWSLTTLHHHALILEYSRRNLSSASQLD